MNEVTGKRYIGSAVNFAKRWDSHKWELRHGTHHSVHLQRAWLKHGAENLKFRPILICAKSHVLFYEQLVLDAYGPEYNICRIAGNILGLKRSDETRAKLSAARKKYVISDETRQKLSIAQSARVYPRDVVEKIRTANTGQKRSAEARARMAAAQMGKTNAKGHRLSAEVRAKMSIARKGRTLTEDHRAKLSAANLGKKLSAEHREKLSAAQSGRTRRPLSPQHRAKIADALLAYWQRKGG